MSTIERSRTSGRFTPQELQAKVRESRAYWSSPAGKARQAQLDRESRNRPATPSTADDAGRAYWMRRAALLEKNAPKF